MNEKELLNKSIELVDKITSGIMEILDEIKDGLEYELWELNKKEESISDYRRWKNEENCH